MRDKATGDDCRLAAWRSLGTSLSADGSRRVPQELNNDSVRDLKGFVKGSRRRF